MATAEVRQPDLSLGLQAALSRGDRRGALALVLEAERSAPQDIGLKLQRAMVSRALGDLTGALLALDEALSLAPYDYVALLSKGAVVERMSGERAAAAIYKNALSIAPPDDKLPEPLRAPTERARQVVARTMAALELLLPVEGRGAAGGRLSAAPEDRGAAGEPADGAAAGFRAHRHVLASANVRFPPAADVRSVRLPPANRWGAAWTSTNQALAGSARPSPGRAAPWERLGAGGADGRDSPAVGPDNDRHRGLETEEVDDERADRDLSAPFPAVEPAAAQRLPQARFAGRLVTPQPAGAIPAQLRIHRDGLAHGGSSGPPAAPRTCASAALTRPLPRRCAPGRGAGQNITGTLASTTSQSPRTASP
jgi:hypothetical protein